MSLMNEGPETQPLDTQTDEFQRLVAPLAPPVEPEAHTSWPLLVAAIGIVAVIIAGGVWWLLSSTVSQNDYDDIAAELDAAEEQLSTTDSALSTAEQQRAAALASAAELQDDFEALEASFQESDENRRASELEADGLRSVVGELESRLAEIDPAVRLLAYIELETQPDLFNEWEAAGGDVTTGDELLGALGESETWSEWSNSSAGWISRDRAVADVGDAELTDAYERWLEAEVGSDDEWVAGGDVILRLVQLIVEPIVGG